MQAEAAATLARIDQPPCAQPYAVATLARYERPQRGTIAMGAYLDRLNAQYDEIRNGIDTLVNRAAEENRDVTDQEQQQVDRDQERLGELQTAITHYSKIENDAAQVADLRARVRPVAPAIPAGPAQPEPYDVHREFPSPAHYAISVHRAMVLKDPEAREKLERATQHQLLANNPGIVPTPVLGPVLNLLDSSRPFIASITTRPLPAGKFDRPYVSQHVDVDTQAAEKTLTASQAMQIDELPVSAKTFAGHLNISRQNIKWTNPSILQIVFDDFAAVYARTTCNEACDSFVASITSAAVPIATWDMASIMGALFSSSATAMTDTGVLPDTLWVAPDVWGRLGSLVTSFDQIAFPGMSLTNQQAGTPVGLRLVVDDHFAAGTMISGPSRFAEWYEDVDGLMQVGEPDVLGQLVGYAGFGAFVNVAPQLYVKYTLPA